MYNEMWLQGNPHNHGHLLIQDAQGHEIGYDHGVFTTKFPGASAVFSTGFTDLNQKPMPVYRIPFGVDVNVTLDGFGLKFPDTETFSLIGQRHDLAIDRIQVRPNEKEHIILSTTEGSMTYVSAGSQVTSSPVFSVGLVTAPGNYNIAVRALPLHRDSVVKLRDYVQAETLAINDTSATGQTFEVDLTRQMNGKVDNLTKFTVTQPPGKTVNILYGQIQNGHPGVQIVG